MALSVVHDSIDDIPEGFRDLYTEREGKHVLTGIAGVKTQTDIDRLNASLIRERDEHKATKNQLGTWGDLKYDQVQAELARIPELEVMAKGNKEEFEEKLEDLATARAKSQLLPVEAELNKTKNTLAEMTTELETLRDEKIQRTVHDQIREVSRGSKMIPEAEPDVLLLADAVFQVTEDGKVMTKENPYGVTPGLSPDVWMTEMKEKRPYWWPNSNGGGAPGSGGGGSFSNNPWSADHWNMTNQGKVITEYGEDKASQMAKAAGVSLGATQPAPRK